MLEVFDNPLVTKNQERIPSVSTHLNFQKLPNFLLLGEDSLDEVCFRVLSDRAAPKPTGPCNFVGSPDIAFRIVPLYDLELVDCLLQLHTLFVELVVIAENFDLDKRAFSSARVAGINF